MILLAIPQARFYRLTKNFDFRADHCGQDQLVNKPYFYMVDPINQGTIGICVDKCPTQAVRKFLLSNTYVFQGNQICFYGVDGVTLLDDYCYSTYVTYTQGWSCAPTPANLEYLQIYNAFFTQPEYLMRRAAGDLYQVRLNFNLAQLKLIRLDFWYYLHWLCYSSIYWASVFAATHDSRYLISQSFVN